MQEKQEKVVFPTQKGKKKHFLKKTVAGAGGKNFINKKMI